ncbi:hypothetical protein DRF59_18670 [Chryseobacterium flavum]|uniref:Bacteriocin n=1 Tax=Chryseobacterium flavum TaxID=415851 RepID=A0A3D9CGN4_9FLAO|nr:bacteriocin [Chryseobacterium flavum]REC64900.1 hypothetical protein DRF59_18670 [Chryseobacterium flavum]
MKNQILQPGKKLSKKELKTIAGGLINCMPAEPCPPYPDTNPCESQADANGCIKISPYCGQKECRP